MGKKQAIGEEVAEEGEVKNDKGYDQKPAGIIISPLLLEWLFILIVLLEKEKAMGIAEVTQLVDKFVLQNTPKKPAASAKVYFYSFYLFFILFIFSAHYFFLNHMQFHTSTFILIDSYLFLFLACCQKIEGSRRLGEVIVLYNRTNLINCIK